METPLPSSRRTSSGGVVIAPQRESEAATGLDPVDGSDTTSFLVRPGLDHWPNVVAAVSRFLRDRTSDVDLVADVDAVLSRVLWEFLRHSDTHGAVVELRLDSHDRVVVEVSAGQSTLGHDLLHALPPDSLLTEHEPGDDDERARTQRILDALAWSWGTERRHRKTTLRFTVGATPGSRVDRVGVTPAARGRGIHAVEDPAEIHDLHDDSMGTAADEASTVARDAAVVASRVAYAAEHARVDRATAAAEAARSIAETAAVTLRELRVHQDERAERVAAVAAAAADQARRSAILDGTVDQPAVVALRVASAVAVSAARAAEEATVAAALVADAVTAAADAVAAATAAAARAAEIEVATAATAMQAATAAAAARRADHDAQERVVLERQEQDTATTLRQLMRTNRRLRDHMRRIDAKTLPATVPIPDTLPTPDGLTVAVRRVGGLGSDYVGEHWYDACVTPSGGTFLILGSIVPVPGRTAEDVQRIRHLLLALVIDRDETPAAAVDGLQRCAHVLGLTTEIALTIVHVCPPDGNATGDATNTREVHWCAVGSPAPLLIDRAGAAASPRGAGSPMLTGHNRVHAVDHSLSVGSGSTVLLHSAGLLGADTDGDVTTALRTVDVTATGGALEAVAGRARWRRPAACGTLLAVTVW